MRTMVGEIVRSSSLIITANNIKLPKPAPVGPMFLTKQLLMYSSSYKHISVLK